MPEPDPKRDLEAVIKATKENRLELKKTQQKMEQLEADIRTLRDSRLGSERRKEKQNPIKL